MPTIRSLITDTDARILLALSRFHYLTAAQAGRLLYPRLSDDNRYMQRRFKRLVDAGFVLRLRSLPAPRYGQAPHVFTLARGGRQYLRTRGVVVPAYFRPAEEHWAAWNDPFMTHRLAAVDVLVAAAALCRDYRVSCPRLLTERHLRHSPIRVPIAAESGQRTVAVIPDGWFQLRVGTQPAYSIAVEVDRATEDQRAWRRKVAGYAAWAQGPYRHAFATDNLTIAVVTPTRERREQLRAWTCAELRARNAGQLADLFLLTHESPVTIPPELYFFDRLWYLPHQFAPVRLIEAPIPPDRALSEEVRPSLTGRLPEEVSTAYG